MCTVSIIIPTFARPDNLRQAIISAASQTYTDVEIIVVNDNGVASPHNEPTRRIVQEISTRFKNILYIEHEVNRNGAAARNSGIRISSGKYITFLDDDDIYAQERISKLVNELEANPHTSFVYSGVAFSSNDHILKFLRPKVLDDPVYELLIQNSFFGTGSNFMCRAELVKKIGGFDESFLRHQDVEFAIRYLHEFPGAHSVDEILVVKQVDHTSKKISPSRFLEVKTLFFERLRPIIATYPEGQQRNILLANNRELIKLTLRHGAKVNRGLRQKTVPNSIKWGKLVVKAFIARVVRSNELLSDIWIQTACLKTGMNQRKQVREAQKILYDAKSL